MSSTGALENFKASGRVSQDVPGTPPALLPPVKAQNVARIETKNSSTVTPKFLDEILACGGMVRARSRKGDAWLSSHECARVGR